MIAIPNDEQPEVLEGGVDAESASVGRASGSMRKVALKGGRWRALEGVLIQGLQVVSTMVLARLLTPDDFGIVAVVTLVLVLFGVLTDVGFGASVVRRESVSNAFLSSMFWASMLLGVVSAGIASLFSPIFASLTGNAAAAPYLAVASLTLVFGMVKSVPKALLVRDFRFRETSMVAISGFLMYMVVAIALAATTDLGAWAIVLGRVGSAVVTMGANWVLSSFLPKFHLRWSEIREDIGFNLSFLGMRGSQYLAKNLDYWFVGSALGSASLGIYYIAYILPNLLRRRMTSVVAGPLFVTVAAFADDRQRCQRAYLEAVRSITLGAGPILIGMALISDGLVRLAFGEQWLDAIEPMAILAVAAAINVIGPVGSGILTAIGMPGRNIVVNLTWSAMIAVGLVATISGGGLYTVAVVVLVATILSKAIQIALLRGPLEMRWRAVFGALLPATASLAVMSGAVLAARFMIGDVASGVVGLLLSIVIAAVTYFGFGFLVFRSVFSSVRGDIKTMLVGK